MSDKTLSYYIARVISDVFIPPVISLFSFIYLYITFLIPEINNLIYLVIPLSTNVIFAVIYFVIQMKKGHIGERDARKKEQRNKTFNAVLIANFLGLTALIILKAPTVISGFLSVYLTSGITVLWVNRTYKISVHSLSVAGGLALMVFVNSYLAIAMFLILLMVMWSRVKLKVHTVNQVISGSVAGFGITYIQLFIINLIFGLI